MRLSQLAGTGETRRLPEWGNYLELSSHFRN